VYIKPRTCEGHCGGRERRREKISLIGLTENPETGKRRAGTVGGLDGLNEIPLEKFRYTSYKYARMKYVRIYIYIYIVSGRRECIIVKFYRRACVRERVHEKCAVHTKPAFRTRQKRTTNGINVSAATIIVTRIIITRTFTRQLCRGFARTATFPRRRRDVRV